MFGHRVSLCSSRLTPLRPLPQVDFGNVILPRPVSDYPRPQRLGRMVTLEHNVASGDVVAVDAQTLLVPDFTYDGEGPGERAARRRLRRY